MVTKPTIGQSGWGEALNAALDELETTASGTYVRTVDAGVNLSTARPAGAVCVLWRFDAGVDVGAEGASVVNGEVGDLYFVASA